MTAAPSTPPFSSPLAVRLERFLALKRAAGCRYDTEAYALRGLDRFLSAHVAPSDPVITRDHVCAWVARRGCESQTTRAHRLTLIRELCRFLARDDHRTAVPERHFLGITRDHFVTRVLTRDEGRAFLRACDHLSAAPWSPLRDVVLGTLLVVLYLSGLRLGEAIRLTVDDVDLTRAVLWVRRGKFGKSRLVPVAADLCARLAACRTRVEQRLGVRPREAPFFPTPRGPVSATYSPSTVRAAFREVLRRAGIVDRSAGRRLRVHDLRHSYAVLRLLLWCEQDRDVNAKLPLLATYMGHVGVTSTQRYLQLTTELLGEIMRRHDAHFGYLIAERTDP
jgi:integrase